MALRGRKMVSGQWRRSSSESEYSNYFDKKEEWDNEGLECKDIVRNKKDINKAERSNDIKDLHKNFNYENLGGERV